jgi:lipoprotein-anchoring transpeptidase ErfK/SrfK
MFSLSPCRFGLLLALCAASRIWAEPEVHAPKIVRPEDTPAIEASDANENDARPVANWLEVQVELARRGFSGGSIDGIRGTQSTAALRSFQRSVGLNDTGELDQITGENLLLSAPAIGTHVVTADELSDLQPVGTTWLAKSEQTVLAYATALESVAEQYHASPNLLKKLNPKIDWNTVEAGTVVQVPAVEHAQPTGRAAQFHIRLAAHELEATDENNRVIAHFPVSIARNVEKRPVGELHVTVVIPNPNYTFDPDVFPESPEAKELGRKLIIQPGPNNPVGVAWIGLDRPGYGIHGTPEPEKVGRTESHGCFRVANWDAQTLLNLAWVGLPVFVEP